jgi:hypothetical protein
MGIKGEKGVDRRSNNKIKHTREEKRRVQEVTNRILHLMDHVTDSWYERATHSGNSAWMEYRRIESRVCYVAATLEAPTSLFIKGKMLLDNRILRSRGRAQVKT